MVYYCASKKRLFLLGLIFFIIMSISGIYALTNEVINSTESTLSTSFVDIEIKEYNKDNNEFTEDGRGVMPGEDISLIPRINNLGIECYIRAKLSYTINGKEYNELEFIDGNYKNWTKDNGYYYYSSILNKNSSVDLFNNVHIPDSLSDQDNATIVVNIIVEAVQAKNFDGRVSSWNGVNIIKAVDRSYEVDPSGDSTIIYENDAERYIQISDNFFGNLGNLLPGDSESETVIIKNNGRNKINYYVSLEYDELTEEEKNLLNNINLIIKKENGTILSESKLYNFEKVLLGTYNLNDTENISFEVSLPKELDNEFSKIIAKVRWKFSVDLIDYNETPTNPVTGKFVFKWSIALFLLSALGFLIVLILERKLNDNIENNN